MSQSQEHRQKLDTAFDRLATVLEQIPDERQSFSFLTRKKSDGIHSCAFGGVGLLTGNINPDESVSKKVLKSLNLFGAGHTHINSIDGILNEFGFTKEEKEKMFDCPEPKCNLKTDIRFLIIHMNDAHHYKRHLIGRIIRNINNLDELPKFTFADNIFRLKESFRTIFKFT